MSRILQRNHTQGLGSTTRCRRGGHHTLTAPQRERNRLRCGDTWPRVNVCDNNTTASTDVRHAWPSRRADWRPKKSQLISILQSNWRTNKKYLFILVKSKPIILRGRIGINPTDCNFGRQLVESQSQPHIPKKSPKQYSTSAILNTDQVIYTLSAHPQLKRQIWHSTVRAPWLLFLHTNVLNTR